MTKRQDKARNNRVMPPDRAEVDAPSSSTQTSTTEKQPGAGLVEGYADQLAIREARAPKSSRRTTEITSPEMAKLCSKYMRMTKAEFALQTDPASATFNLDTVFAEVKQMAATGLTQAPSNS